MLVSKLSNGFLETRRHGVWVPAFAGTTWMGCRNTHFRVLAAHCARVLQIHLPSKMRGRTRPSREGARDPQERARGRPGARCTRGLMCKSSKQKRTRAYRFSGNTPAFPAQWFYSLFRALPGETKACLSPSSPRSLLLKNLTPAIGASGPHDFAVRFSRARQSQPSRPPLPAPTSVTMANAPSLGTGWRQ
jgi:hypothetical protein